LKDRPFSILRPIKATHTGGRPGSDFEEEQRAARTSCALDRHIEEKKLGVIPDLEIVQIA
jgi:hypothetical protein